MDDKDITIMLHLLAAPDISNKEIADQTGISQATVSRRIKQLYDNKILYGKYLNINYHAIGMSVYHLFFHVSRNWRRSVVLLQLLFERHAYTIYQNKIFGAFQGVLVQIALPGDEHLDEFCEQIIKAGIAEDVSIYRQTFDSTTFKIDPTKYDMESGIFRLNLNSLKDSTFEDRDDIELSRSEVNPKLMNRDMINLIFQFSLDANRSLEEIGNQLGKGKNEIVSKQEVSRRKKQANLDEWEYSTRYDRKQFGVFNQCFYILNSNNIQLKNLYYLLKEHYPFYSTIIPTDSAILLWIDLPAINVMEFTEILSQRFSSVKFFLLSRSSKYYLLWNENMKEDGWDKTKENIVMVYDASFKNRRSLAEFITECKDKTNLQLEKMYDETLNNN